MTKQQTVRMLGMVLAMAALAATSAHAITSTVTLSANDAANTSSFNNAGNWSSAAAPAAGSGYSTLGYLLRSPVVSGAYQSGNWTFAGDSLTVGGGNGGGANPFLTTGVGNNNALIVKASGLNLTVNNLILDGGTVRDGLGDNNTWSLNGNITVTANGGGFIAQALGTINSAISGSGPIYIGDQGNTGTARGIFFASGSSTYNGNIYLVAAVANRSRLTFNSGSVMNFTIGASGVNNSISGANGYAEFAGAFNLDLSGASTAVGDNWTLVSTGTKVFDSTFSINGFTSNGAGLWDDIVGGTDYEFNTATGILSVPEPSTFVLGGLGLAGLLILARRRQA
jgi:hypothetical protein